MAPDARLAAAVLLVLGAARAGAQRLAGRVTDGGLRVPGAIVMLLRDDGSVAARAVSGEDGGYELSAPASGTYRVRVLRIGFRPTAAGPFALAAGTTTRGDVALSSRVRLLPEVRVTDRTECRVRPDTAAAAFALWDEARTALLAAVLSERQPLGVRMTRHERMLDASGDRVVADTETVSEGSSRQPIQSLPPDSLARMGYTTRDERGGTTYWGPDADVLLSESFASTHCIRPEPPPADTGALAGVLGVAFEPVGSRRANVDVRGVLWMDRRSAELRSLDYSYVNVAPIIARAGAGGHVEFLRLPDGTWTVSRWWIRSPVIETTVVPDRVIPGSSPERSTQRVLGIKESRGDLLELRRNGATWWQRGRVSVAIRVLDSSGAVARALVSLDDSTRSVATADDGVVEFDRVVPGPARVDVRVAALDSLGAPRLRMNVTVPDHPFAPIVVRVPSAERFFASRCGVGGGALDWDEGAVRGRLPHGAGARVEVSWAVPYTRLGGGEPVVVREVRAAASDSSGAFFVCGVPRNLSLTVRVASLAEATLPARTVQVPAGARVAIVDFDR